MLPYRGYNPNLRFGDPGDVLVFHHIPKTAGTTFHNILSDMGFPVYFCNHAVHWPVVWEKVEATEGPCVISGHHLWGIHEHLMAKKRFFYVTFLRDPIRMIKSLYLFLYFRYEINQSFDEYICSKGYSPNPLCTSLGSYNPVEALSNLENSYFLFGLTEEFPTSLEMFRECLPLNSCKYTALNRTNSHEKLSLSNETLRILEDQNKLDMELYSLARTVFDSRLHDLGLTTIQSSLPTRDKKSKELQFEAKHQQLIFDGPYKDAIKLFEKGERSDINEIIEKIAIAKRFNQFEDVERFCIEANHQDPGVANLDLAQCLSAKSPEKAVEIVCREILEYLPFRTMCQNSSLNYFLLKAFDILWQILEEYRSDSTVENDNSLDLNPFVSRCLEVYNHSDNPQTTPEFLHLLRSIGMELLLKSSSKVVPLAASIRFKIEISAIQVFLQRLKPGSKVLIYGCGQISKNLVNSPFFSRSHDMCFATSFNNQSNDFFGFPLRRITEIQSNSIDVVLILSYEYEQEMIQNVSSWEQEKIFTIERVLSMVYGQNKR